MSEQNSAGTSHVFGVSLGGLLELLSGALYTTESVFVRELIQNGVDAVVARRVLEPGWEGGVHLQVSEGDDGLLRLVVEDDGIGLSAEDVHRFLATIGASAKRGELERQRDEGFIGQFGVGFLSCFMVADEVTLVTRRAGVQGSRALRWRGSRDGSYTLEELAGGRAPGSAVYLTLRGDTRETYDGSRILGLARKFGGFLDVPVEFSCGEVRRERVNPARFPWETASGGRGAVQKRWVDFAEKMLRTRFLGAFRVECGEGGVSGLACILEEPAGVLDVPQHLVFLKGMFLSREVEGLAPREMPFLRCLVNGTRLKPNAAREGLQDAERVLAAVRGEVARGLAAFLVELREEDPRLLAEILRIHQRSFTELAAEDPRILKLVAPHLQFETSLGPKSLEELGGSGAFFIESYEDFRRVEAFAAAHSLLVVNAGYSGVGRLLRRLDAESPGRRFRETDSRQLRWEWTREVQVSEPLQILMDRARRVLRPVRARVELTSDPRAGMAATFEVSPRDSVRRRSAARGRDFLAQPMEEPSDAVLILNTAHGLVQALCDPEVSGERVEAVLGVLYQQALLAAREVPSVAEDGLFYGSLERLLNVGGE